MKENSIINAASIPQMYNAFRVAPLRQIRTTLSTNNKTKKQGKRSISK